jgi:hypothetical protein
MADESPRIAGGTIIQLSVAETGIFARAVEEFWDDQELWEFVDWISVNYDHGDVIPGSGGVRKVRWRRPGSGKRGGVRVIYFVKRERGKLWLLTAYAKSTRDNLSIGAIRRMRELVDD